MSNELSTITTGALSLFDSSRFELAMKQADFLAKSDLIPKAFQAKPENCLIALELADRMNASAFMVMQNVDIIHGKPGFSAKFLVGCFNASGKYSPIQYRIEVTGETKTVPVTFERWEGPQGNRKKVTERAEWTYTPTTCIAYATHLATGALVEGPPVSYDLALQEGWVSKDGSKWLTEMRELMLRYRAATFLIRTTAPEISLGLPTSDEIEDTGGAMGHETRDITPKTPFARAKAEPAPVVASVEVVEEKPDPLEVIKAKLAASGLKVSEALGALATLGIGDGKTPFSKMDPATLEKAAADWSTVFEVAVQLRGEGGEG